MDSHPAGAASCFRPPNDAVPSLFSADDERFFDELLATAAEHFGAKAAFISTLSGARQIFVMRHGLPLTRSDSRHAFCRHPLQIGEPMVVLNAERDPRFADNPLVTGAPYIRFYAGAPFSVETVFTGVLCVIDDQPHFRFTSADQRALRFFATAARGRVATSAGRRSLSERAA